MTRAECTWGDGPDVLVIVTRDAAWVPYEHDSVEAGSFGLRAKEARRLAAQLIAAAENVDELERLAALQSKQ